MPMPAITFCLVRLTALLCTPLGPAHAAPVATDGEPRASGAAVVRQAPPAPAALYALAVERLLAHAGDSADVYVLPSAAARPGEPLRVRPRRASGPPVAASAATARQVVALLRARGTANVRGTRERLAADDALQVVLGELRFEPAATPTFARLRLDVVGAGGAHQTMDVLLRRERAGWRALKMEAADNIGMAPAGLRAVVG